MRDGANPGCTSLRYRVWSGGSVCIIVGGLGYSTPISNVRIPLPEQNVSGSREIATTSACFETAQYPSCAFHASGASRRSRA